MLIAAQFVSPGTAGQIDLRFGTVPPKAGRVITLHTIKLFS